MRMTATGLAVINNVFFWTLVAGPGVVLLSRKGLPVLDNPKLSFGDVAQHGIHHLSVFW